MITKRKVNKHDKYLLEIESILMLVSEDASQNVKYVYKVKDFPDMYLDDVGISRLQRLNESSYYTEEDVAKIRRLAYQHGFEDGRAERCSNSDTCSSSDSNSDILQVGDVVSTPTSGNQVILKLIESGCISINSAGHVFMFPLTSLRKCNRHLDGLSEFLSNLDNEHIDE